MKVNISEKVELTPGGMRTWEETLTAFSWQAAPFVHPLYELLNPDKGRMIATFLGDKKVAEWMLAGTNGKRLFLVADRFLSLTLGERIFLLSHEVSHPMLGHIVASNYYRQRKGIKLGLKFLPWSDLLANFSQDYVINDLLVESRIGKFIEGGCWDKSIATYKDSWIDVYERLLTQCQARPGSGVPQLLDGSGNPVKPGKGKGVEDKDGSEGVEGEEGAPQRGDQSPFDVHMGFGEGEPKDGEGEADPDDPDVVDLNGGNEPVSDEDLHKELQKAKQAAAAGMELARARGTLPAAMQIFVEKILEPVVSWEDHLFSSFARRLGSGGYDFRRPDRRFLTRDIIVAGRTGFCAERIIIGMDTSGSIFGVPKLIDRWWGETGGILEQMRAREIHCVFCDASVQKVVVVDDPTELPGIAKLGVRGGGGTSFVPVFKYIDELNENIDCLVYLTDGEGTFPKRAPEYPVIWGDISNGRVKYPFGDVVRIPV